MNSRRGARRGTKGGVTEFAASAPAAGAAVPPSRPVAGRAPVGRASAESGHLCDGAWPDLSASRSERNGLLKYGLTMEPPLPFSDSGQAVSRSRDRETRR